MRHLRLRGLGPETRNCPHALQLFVRYGNSAVPMYTQLVRLIRPCCNEHFVKSFKARLTEMSEQTYRPDIDGLRAVAVVLVLLFHANLCVPGGFIGVDVFFVISGYLITGLIWRQQQEGTFSLRNFWSRRIRRIIPASVVMATGTLVAGAILLFPVDYEELARSTIAQQTMLSNVFFWRNTGYFQGPAELKPLLHTWSLAVEEQFYLIYPLVLIAMARMRPRSKASLLAVVAVVSFAISEWGCRHHPSATFYLLPTRAWELLLGGVLCFLPSKPFTSRKVSLLLSIAGISMIVIAAISFDSATRFPGFSATLPCFGTAFIIASNTGQLNFVGRLLSLKPLVFVGLLSYSLYLWHWPILAFARYWLGEELSYEIISLSLCASVLLAYVSWKYVEAPLRRSKSSPYNRPILVGICTTAPILIGVSIVVYAGEGLPSRVSTESIRLYSARSSRAFINDVSVEEARSGNLPRFGSPNGGVRCLVWGDSHAMALMPGIDSACQKLGVQGFQATHSSTPPLLDFVHISRWGLNEATPIFGQAVVEFVRQNDIDVVVLSGVWSSYAQHAAFEERLEETVKEVTEFGAQVVIVLDVATHDVDVPSVLARRAYWRLPSVDIGVPIEAHRSRNEYCDNIIRRVANGRAIVVDPAPYFVNSNGIWQAVVSGEVMYCDSNHLSFEGGLRLEGAFSKVLDSTLCGG